MQFPALIKTLKLDNEFRFKEKGSEFIGFATQVSSQSAADEKLAIIKKKFYDATHNCYAYKILPDIVKYSDDGEPNGTAGIRILNAIDHHELCNVLIIVTRFYGGTKLGVGPLGRAYYSAAEEVIKSAAIVMKENYSLMSIEFDFEYSKTVHHFLNLNACIIKQNRFENRPVIEFLIKPDNTSAFENNIRNATKDQSKIQLIETAIFIEKN